MRVGVTPTAFPIEEVRQVFPGAVRNVYLNSAAESLFMVSHRDALVRYARHKEGGSAGREACAAVESRCRSLVAEMIGVRAEDVAFLASTARGLDVAIRSIDWREGNNIVLADSEFPTTAFAAARLARSGIERRIVLSRGGELRLEDFAEQIDSDTRLVCASTVSYKTGFKLDIAGLAEIAHGKGALLFADAIQALGVIPIDAGSTDFLCAGTYKWQLGAHGLAAFYINPAIINEVEVPYVAYRGVSNIFPPNRFDSYDLFADARRFEEGMPNYSGMFVLENGLSFLLSLGMERISSYVGGLVRLVMDGLDDMGIEPLTTHDSTARAAIVSLETTHAPEIAAALADQDTYVWGRDGRLRISPHLYNSEEDIRLFLARVGARYS